MNETAEFTIPKINLVKPRLKRTEKKVAEVIALPIALILLILFYLVKLITKILYKAKRWLWRVSIFTFIFFIASSNLTLIVEAPQANAAMLHPYIAPIITPAPTEKDIIYAQAHGDILYRIWTLESSRGNNGRLECQSEGKRNDFGFNVANHQCFTNFTDEVTTVNTWFDTELKNHSLSESLCIYNVGVDEDSCAYERNFLSI